MNNSPLATYPGAIKDAAKLFDQDKINDAKRQWNDGFCHYLRIERGLRYASTITVDVF